MHSWFIQLISEKYAEEVGLKIAVLPDSKTEQKIANYSHSYNYFVYNLEDGYDYIKVVARYVTTPLYVGYKIPQTCDEERAAKIIQDIAPYFHASK